MMHQVTRRSAIAAATSLALFSRLARAGDSPRKFTIDLCPGRIGVSVGQEQAVKLASQHGFESVEPQGGFLAGLGLSAAKDFGASLAEHGLVWGAAGLSVEFRADEKRFKSDLEKLPSIAAALSAAGVTRVGTWLRPNHKELTYLANFKQHSARLREVARVLADHGLRFGLEYVGPRTLWAAERYPFVHSMAETKELLAAINMSNVGFVLDSWHWYTAEETLADLQSLSNEEVVAVDLNDAPAGIDVREQIDNRRELPAATGVIDVKTFLEALVEIGYDGPVRAEPFNQPLNKLDDQPAVAKTAAALKKAVATLG